MIINFFRKYKIKLVKLFDFFYAILLVVICCISSVLLLIGTFKKISLCLKIGAVGFCIINLGTFIHQVINGKKKATLFIFILLAVALLIIAVYI